MEEEILKLKARIEKLEKQNKVLVSIANSIEEDRKEEKNKGTEYLLKLITGYKSKSKLLEKTVNELSVKNEVLDDFVYRVSHDLKSPVTSILGLVKMIPMVQKHKEEEVTTCLNHIEKLSTKFLVTIEGLFALTRIENQFSDRKIELIDLEKAINIVLEDVIEETGFKGTELVLDLNKASQISISQAEIRSLFKNLISNSIKYRFNNPLEIKICSYVEGDMIHVDYTDNGVGIDLAKHGENLFKMFKRFHDHIEGTGLGLYIVKRIVTNCGGTIKVESEVDKGTTFRMTFRREL